jgi:hypothetical protein
MKYNVIDDENLLATIIGSQSIESDLEEIYDALEYCPDTFREWVQNITLEPVCEALSMAEALGAESIEEDETTWEEWLQERFPLPSNRNLTMGRITLNIPESWNIQCAEKTEILDENGGWLKDEYEDSILSGAFGMGSGNRVQVHSPDFWLNLAQITDIEHNESAVSFVKQCTIEWYDPFNR